MPHPSKTEKSPKPLPGKGRGDESLLNPFACALGCCLGLALLKFGNPVTFDRLIEPPKEFWEYVFQPWPVRWGYALLAVCLGLLLLGGRLERPHVPKWALIAPGVWLGWQFLASATTIDARATTPTLIHFVACVFCYVFGLCGLGRITRSGAFWIPVLIAFVLALWTGLEQHYGGLEATRKMFYEQPNWQQFSPDYIKKIQSNRIFGTLVYPNALAGAILLFLPPLLVQAWRFSSRVTPITRGVLVGALAYVAVACLYWSGSKSGWLIGLVVALVMLLRYPIPRSAKLAVIGSLLALGLLGFFVKFSAYFRRGAPSVSARFEYWKAAVDTAIHHPVLGTGPGSFAAAYRRIKPPDAEMAQLVHNDYLEQASDSGIVGCLAYAVWIFGSITMLGKALQINTRNDLFALWLGLLGWTLQSFVEFLLYIPAISWFAFAMLGWLWAHNRRTIESTPSPLETRIPRTG